MRQPPLTLRGYLNVLLVDIAARRARRTPALALGALLATALLLAAAIGLRPAGNIGLVRDAALSAPAAGGAAASTAGALPLQAEIGWREYLPGEATSGSGSRPSPLGGFLEYLPGEGPAVAIELHDDGAAPLEYLPGEAPAGAGGTVVPLVGPQP